MRQLRTTPVAAKHYLATLQEDQTRDLDEASELLWRSGVFACELRALIDPEIPAVLCVLKDGEAVIEVPVLSALEAEERALALKVVIERHQPE